MPKRKMSRLQHVLMRKAEWYIVNLLWKSKVIKYAVIAFVLFYFLYETGIVLL